MLLKFVGLNTIYVSIVPPDFHYASEQIDTLERLNIGVIAGAGVVVAAAFCFNLLLTPTAAMPLDAQAMTMLRTNGAVTTIHGNGRRAIHVFLSTECSYCRKIEPELARLKNVTVYRDLLPRRTEQGRLSAVDVLCSENPARAWQRVAAGGQISSPGYTMKCDEGTLEKNLSLAKRFRLSMTPNIVYEDGQVSAGMLLSGQISARPERQQLPSRAAIC